MFGYCFIVLKTKNNSTFVFWVFEVRFRVSSALFPGKKGFKVFWVNFLGKKEDFGHFLGNFGTGTVGLMEIVRTV